MTTNVTKPKTEAAAPAAPTVKAVKPLYAIHEINPFGNGNHAPADSIFVPVSKDERDELLALEAARELTEDEKLIFAAKTAASSTPASPAPAAGAEDEIK